MTPWLDPPAISMPSGSYTTNRDTTRLRAVNYRIIAESGEAYHNREDCLAAINLVKGSGSAPVQDE